MPRNQLLKSVLKLYRNMSETDVQKTATVTAGETANQLPTIMKIIGKTYQGYICEVTKNQMQMLTGVSESYAGDCHSHKLGAELQTIKLGQHIKAMEHTATQRKQAADLLRSAATIIETVPDTFKAPELEEATTEG